MTTLLPVVESRLDEPSLAINPELAARWLEAFLRDELVERRGIGKAILGLSGGTCAFSPRGDLIASAGPLDECVVKVQLDRAEVDIARATIPLLGDLSAVLPDLWLDEEIPVTRRLEERG